MLHISNIICYSCLCLTYFTQYDNLYKWHYFIIFYGWVIFHCWSWNSNTLATSCEEFIHWKRPWCWEGLGAGGEGDDRGWDGWMASLIQWTWVWVNSGSWWWTGRPGVLWFMGSQRVGHNWVTELNWTEYSIVFMYHIFFIHSSVDGHLGHFHVLSIVNSVAVNIGVHVSFWILVFSGYMPMSGVAHMVVLVLVFF